MDERYQDPHPIKELEASQQPQDTVLDRCPPKPANEHSAIELHAIVSDPIADLQAALSQAVQVSRRVKSVDNEQQKHIKKLAADLDKQKKAHATLLQEKQTLEQELVALRAQLDRLKTEHETAEACVSSLTKERELNRAELATTASMLHKAKSDNHQLQRQLMECEQINRTLRHESDRHRKKMAHTADTITAFKQIIQQLEESGSESLPDPASPTDSGGDSFESWLGRKIEAEKLKTA